MVEEIMKLKVFVNSTTGQPSVMLPKEEMKRVPATVPVKIDKKVDASIPRVELPRFISRREEASRIRNVKVLNTATNKIVFIRQHDLNRLRR